MGPSPTTLALALITLWFALRTWTDDVSCDARLRTAGKCGHRRSLERESPVDSTNLGIAGSVLTQH